jgi:UDP-2,4-diacetamido-2,4,6-trideoxy-beta-L-altropyranose hydrolase
MFVTSQHIYRKPHDRMKIVFRTDSSIQIGSGHLMRCLTLANALYEKGAEITFVCREHTGHLFDLIESTNHQLTRLSLPTSWTGGKLAHAEWLGASQEEDAQQTAEALKIIGRVDWLIVDHYALDIEWETAMRLFTKRIMVIDDLADRKHDCDLLLDQNLHLDMGTRYKKLVPLSCKILLGPKYALLRPEFKVARSGLKMRDGSVKRIFIFFGGSDPTNETGKTLRAIQQLDRTDIAIDVVVGATNPFHEDIASICAELSEAKLHCQINNMANLMARADIAIGAGGSTTWERCALSLPTLTISVAENQVSIAEGVDQTNAQIYLGAASEVTSEIIAAQLERLLQQRQELIAMSEAGQRLVDANGSHRIIEALKG